MIQVHSNPLQADNVDTATPRLGTLRLSVALRDTQ